MLDYARAGILSLSLSLSQLRCFRSLRFGFDSAAIHTRRNIDCGGAASLLLGLRGGSVGNKTGPVTLSRSMASEVEKAHAAAKPGQTASSDTIFGKIVRGEIPCQKVYEDDKCLAFHDLTPQAPVHIILVPKEIDGLTRLTNATESNKEILGHLMWTVSVIAKKENIGDLRVVINDGPKGCQSVYHLHLHILGGRQMNWPPG
eukprot:GHVS01014493.1.p1 GENE.GHVS01014493.1~~GHVS01014493.1.p1  ORF type:complete len:202 (+),score=20.17 GHVS01014493.1:32-637(+)